MDQELLKILVCPETKRKLTMASDKSLKTLNDLIQSGKCKDIGGELVQETLAEGLLEKDSNTIYPVRDGIPVLIYENGIRLPR